MNTEKVLNEIKSLSPEGIKILENFIEFLKIKYPKTRAKRKNQKINSIKKNKFIGIWKDREEMKNSIEYIRKLREKEWRYNSNY